MRQSLQNVQIEVTSGRPWPGITFSLESDEGKAILGTPTGLGVAKLLLDHRDLLGRKETESISYFTDGARYNVFSLAFHIVDIQ